tara:strand:- start:1909 stop:2139 length:231 start_codon:yes stop_codon:yes gene_type:complete
MSQKIKLPEDFFASELLLQISGIDTDNVDDFEIHNNDVKSAALCSIALSQMQIAERLVQIDIHLGDIAETLNKKEG